MAHPLEQKISQVRSQARRLLTLYALGWTLAAVTASMLLLGLVDYLIRFQDHGIRLMCSLAVALVALGAFRRFWLFGWRRALGDLQIARRIERRFPSLTDRLASAVEFLKQPENDPHAGSAALRRAVILETSSDVEQLDVSQVFERSPARRALWAGGVVVLVAAGVAMFAPGSAWIALLRLAHPFGDDAWPRFYSVAFHDTPTRLAAGQTFEVELVHDATHRVPHDVRIHFRCENLNGTAEEDSEPMHLLNGAMVARKENVTRPFSYRAEGGDDRSMPWIRLEVVEPPKLESLQLTLHPPEYTGLPVETSEKSIHALRGTRVELSGTSTKKLRSVRVCQDNGPELAAQLSADGYGFTLGTEAKEPLVVDHSGSYWILLEDVEGLTGGAEDRWDIRAITDQAPSVAIEQPAANIFVTPQGEVPLKIMAKDDLAIHQVALNYGRSDRTDIEDFSVPLYAGPDKVSPPEAAAEQAAPRSGDSRTLTHLWQLSELNLKPGTQVTFWATAVDYLPQTGKSSVRRVAIITPAELEERLAKRQMLIFGELQRVLKMQQDARTQTKSLEIQFDAVGRLNKQDVDNAQAAELNQRQIARTLTSPAEGIPAQITDFLTELQSNRVDSPDMQRNMRALADELERLHQQHLGAIERELTSVIKAAQSKLPADSREPDQKESVADPLLGRALTSAGQNQDQVASSLESMLNQLRQWGNYRRFARDIAQLQKDQNDIAQGTKDIGQKTLGRDLKDLDAQQQADLKKLSSQQIELSRRLEKVQQQMSQMAGSLKQADPLSAATISDALHQAQQQGISGQMRQASEQLEKNQLGQATQQQSKTAKDLEDLMAILSNRREQELTRLVKQLREAEQDMARLRTHEAGLQKQMRAIAEQKNPTPQDARQLERLTREQKKLEDEAGRLARRLERLQAEQAGRTTSGAAGKMGQSGRAGQQGDAAEAEQQAEKAEKDLEEAQQQLAQRRRQAEEDLAREQLARLDDSLKSLQARQAKLILETQSLEQSRLAKKPWTRAQRSTVRDLARQQAMMREETSALAEKLSLAEVIHMALDGAAGQMSKAAELLGDQETGSRTQKAQETGRRRIEQLLTALENKPKPAGEGQQREGEGEGAGAGGGSGPDGAGVLTQLKLLKILQEDLNGRYRTVTTPETPGDSDGRELVEIATEQGKLADLALKLAQPSDDGAPEDDPEKLPDVRPDRLQSPDAVPPVDKGLDPKSQGGS